MFSKHSGRSGVFVSVTVIIFGGVFGDSSCVIFTSIDGTSEVSERSWSI